jgi:hypothetical protein
LKKFTYTRIGTVEKVDIERLKNIVCGLFAGCAELRAFIVQDLSLDLSVSLGTFNNDVEWMTVYVIESCIKRSFFGWLIAALLRRSPSNVELINLVTELELRRVVRRFE